MHRSFRPPRLAAVLALASTPLAAAQAPPTQVVVSLTDSGTLPGGTVEDEELVALDVAGQSRLFFGDQALAFYFGDRNGDGVVDEPADVDALEFLPVAPGAPMAAGIVFSLLADQNGIADGDVVRFDPAAPGGIEVLYAESTLVQATGANDGNLDVDAIAIDPAGNLWFSLAEDEAVGPANVVVQDEAVWLLPAGATDATVAYAPALLEQFVSNALGATTTIGDVLSIAWHGDDLLFTVQSPSAHDGTIFSTALGGSIHDGFVEAAYGFTNQVEVDALALFVAPPVPTLEVDAPVVAEGLPVQLRATGLTPANLFLVLASMNPLPAGAGIAAGGFGALALDPGDPFFVVAMQNGTALLGASDVAGNGTFAGTAPVTGQPYDLALQLLDPAGRLSHPVMLEVNQ